MPRVRRSGLVLALVLATTLAGLAPGASAVIVHGAHGHFFGVTLHRGVSPTRIPGSVPAQRAARGLSSPGGNLNYQGGPVLHSSTSYLIYWTPSGESIPASWQGLLGRYFTDAAADSGKASNVYAVARQYTDHAGFADYQQTFSPSSQVIVDTQAYPTTDSAACPSSFPHCITDIQLQQELSRLIAADQLPIDGPAGATELPGSAPIYFVVLPPNVDQCFTAQGSVACADSQQNGFCAYHSSYADSANNNVLYAAIPTLVIGGPPQDPKACQSDNNSLVQKPNGSPADVVLKYVSHEHNETITDPLGNGWNSTSSGNENGDNCNQYGPLDPANGTNPNAFNPTLGSSPGLYNQTINGDNYYLQSEWSNGDADCEMEPSSGTITSHFNVPTGTHLAGTSLSFSPSGSASSKPYTSETWNFGDGTRPVFNTSGSGPSAQSHTYSAVGRYSVTLTLVDNRGNLAIATQQVPVGSPPTAAFTSSPSQPVQNTAVSFDGSSSSDPDTGVSISDYSWNFGDGGPTFDAATSPTTTHTYPIPGTYTVVLTITNSLGLSRTTSHQVTVLADEAPTASLMFSPTNPAVNQQVAFSETANDSDGSITNYSWDFGDGTPTSSGMFDTNPDHAYATSGTYIVTLTVQDSGSQTSTVTQQITVGPVAAFTSTPAEPLDGTPVSFDGSSSSDPESTLQAITDYSWNFGDGTPPSRGTSQSAIHSFVEPGAYTVTLTVTNNNSPVPETNAVSHIVTVGAIPPTAAFAITTAALDSSQPVQFDAFASASSDPNDSIASYSWNFGDGTTTTGANATPTHAYATAGPYTVQLTVTDTDGRTSNPVTQQLVVHPPPTASFTISPSQPLERAPVSFNFTGSTEPGTAISSYAWSLGDGTPTASGATPIHSYASPGTYIVRLTVTNSLGLTATTSQPVTVVDEDPHAAFVVKPAHPASGQPVSFDGSASSDPDGSISSYRWDFGDGTRAGSGSKPTHVYRKPGSYTVRLTITDSAGLSVTARGRASVALAGRITRISFANGAGGPKLLVAVNGPGVLSAGRKTARVKKAGTAKFAIRLTAAQQSTLSSTDQLQFPIQIRFAPFAGLRSARTVTIAFLSAGPGTARIRTVLKR